MELKVMVVEDSSTMRKMLRKIILMSGVPVKEFYEAGNGEDGLKLIHQKRPDLVMVDLNMPGINGLEMIRQLRASPEFANLPIIVISTDSSQARMRQIRGQGIHFIHKPFKSAQIQEIMQAYEKFSSPRITEQLLDQVAHIIFKRLAFLTLQPQEPDGQVLPGSRIRAMMRFVGPFRGTLIMDASEKLLPILHNNMLGLDRDYPNTEQERLDALGEMANVLCGNLLELLAGPSMVFDLGAPNIEVDASPQIVSKEKAFIRRWVSENGWIELYFIRDSNLAMEKSGKEEAAREP
jgi:two-component system chemotaxis response regulator CheY